MQQLHMVGLIDQTFATAMDPTISRDTGMRLHAEAFEHNCTLEVLHPAFYETHLMTIFRAISSQGSR
jgi:hypothetical protein